MHKTHRPERPAAVWVFATGLPSIPLCSSAHIGTVAAATVDAALMSGIPFSPDEDRLQVSSPEDRRTDASAHSRWFRIPHTFTSRRLSAFSTCFPRRAILVSPARAKTRGLTIPASLPTVLWNSFPNDASTRPAKEGTGYRRLLLAARIVSSDKAGTSTGMDAAEHEAAEADDVAAEFVSSCLTARFPWQVRNNAGLPDRKWAGWLEKPL